MSKRFIRSIVFAFVLSGIVLATENSNSMSFNTLPSVEIPLVDGKGSKKLFFDPMTCRDSKGNWYLSWVRQVKLDGGPVKEMATFYKVVDKNGNTIVPLKRIMWRGGGVLVDSHDRIWYLQKPIYSLDILVYRLKLNGETVWKTTVKKANMNLTVRLFDKQGNLYIIGDLGEGGYRRMPLYYIVIAPNGEIVKEVTKIPYEKEIEKDISGDFSGCFISPDRIFICGRVRTGKYIKDEFGYGVAYDSQDSLLYFVMDTNGNIVTEPKIISFKKVAFRKAVDAYLPLDVSKAGNGSIIVSVTSTDENLKHILYQVKFSVEGKLFPSPTLTEVKSLPAISKLKEEKGIKLKHRTWHRPQYKHIEEYYLFGFDNEGTFYYTKKFFPWKW